MKTKCQEQLFGFYEVGDRVHFLRKTTKIFHFFYHILTRHFLELTFSQLLIHLCERIWVSPQKKIIFQKAEILFTFPFDINNKNSELKVLLILFALISQQNFNLTSVLKKFDGKK
jgi:hypothetical protein